jgi:hypothetical protein
LIVCSLGENRGCASKAARIVFLWMKKNSANERFRARLRAFAKIPYQGKAFDFLPRAYLTFRSAQYDRKREVISEIAESIGIASGHVVIKLNVSYENLLKF